MTGAGSVKVKGGPLLSRLAFVREHRGEAGVQNVLARLSESDRNVCTHLLTGGWYPFALNEKLDEAVAAEMGMGENVFLLMGEKSAEQNLSGPHKAMVCAGDPHGLLKRTPQIYQMYYDTGRRRAKGAELCEYVCEWKSPLSAARGSRGRTPRTIPAASTRPRLPRDRRRADRLWNRAARS